MRYCELVCLVFFFVFFFDSHRIPAPQLSYPYHIRKINVNLRSEWVLCCFALLLLLFGYLLRLWRKLMLSGCLTRQVEFHQRSENTGQCREIWKINDFISQYKFCVVNLNNSISSFAEITKTICTDFTSQIIHFSIFHNMFWASSRTSPLVAAVYLNSQHLSDFQLTVKAADKWDKKVSSLWWI